eukprot:724931-Amphidinium_carterae.1
MWFPKNTKPLEVLANGVGTVTSYLFSWRGRTKIPSCISLIFTINKPAGTLAFSITSYKR